MTVSTDQATSPAASSIAGEIVTTTQSRVSCSGAGGALGHPKIWLTTGTDGRVTCPYCSRQFVQEARADSA